MEIVYKLEAYPELHPDEFIDLLERSTLAERRPVEEAETVRGMLVHADVIVTARAGGLLVGVSRAITDFHYCTYLSDLAVDEKWQRRGIGLELIKRTHEAAGTQTTLIVLAAPQAHTYYPHVGFFGHDSCWYIPRQPAPVPGADAPWLRALAPSGGSKHTVAGWLWSFRRQSGILNLIASVGERVQNAIAQPFGFMTGKAEADDDSDEKNNELCSGSFRARGGFAEPGEGTDRIRAGHWCDSDRLNDDGDTGRFGRSSIRAAHRQCVLQRPQQYPDDLVPRRCRRRKLRRRVRGLRWRNRRRDERSHW